VARVRAAVPTLSPTTPVSRSRCAKAAGSSLPASVRTNTGLEDMTANAEARLAEARENVWLGEVAALEEILTHLRRRRAEAEARHPHPIVEFS
jgi:hypothetical protein